MKYYKRYRVRIKPATAERSYPWYYSRKDILPPEGVKNNSTEWFDWMWGNLLNEDGTPKGRNLEGQDVIVEEHDHNSFKGQYKYIGLAYLQAGKFGDYIHKDDCEIRECLGEFDVLGRKKK